MESIVVRDGDCYCEVEPTTGFVRNLCAHGEQILQAVYCAVRDERWGTFSPIITEFHPTHNGCVWNTHAEGAPFAWRTEVAVTRDSFRVTIDGEAVETFRTSRTGLCLLHPLSVCGLPVTVLHVDGSSETSCFPELIAPHQPFMEVGGFRYTTLSGLQVEIALEGEVFETEDQRNWSDASFKTYCHRLGDGRPYLLETGQRVRQEVRVRVSGHAKALQHEMSFQAPFPAWFVNLDVQDGRVVRSLAGMGVSGVTVEGVSAVPATGGLPVDLRLTMQELPQVSPCAPSGVGSVLWLVCDRWSPEAEEALQRMRTHWEPLGWQLGYSSSANFAELNRSRPPQGAFAWLGAAASPQVHTFDLRSILENAPALADIGRTMATFGGRCCAGPITFGSRFTGADPRVDEPPGAAYLLLALAAAARGGFSRVLTGKVSHLLDAKSVAGQVMRELLEIHPQTVTQDAEGDLIRLRFTGAMAVREYVVNTAPRVLNGIEPFTVRRV